MSSDALLELGVEHLPARFIAPALDQLKSLAASQLQERRLPFESVEAYGTPRRLAVLVRGVPAKSEDVRKTVLGPPARLLRDEKGAFTPQALGFARAQGVRPEELKTASSPRGEVLSAELVVPGRRAEDILAESFQGVVEGLRFPKSMYWEESGFRFARPIRSLAALYGRRALRLAVGGVKSGRLAAAPSEFAKPGSLRDAASYVDELKRKLVIVEPEKRREAALSAIASAAKSAGAEAEPIDEALLHETVYSVERPVAVVGSFSEAFLALPTDLVVTTLKKQVGLFPLWKGGRLQPKFVAIRDGSSENQKEVREGYERVVVARLDDAIFYYQRDRKSTLEQLRVKLQGVLYQKDLGTLFDKSERVRKIAARLCADLREEHPLDEKAAEAIGALAYADLASEVVGSFPELQGRIGAEYARGDRLGERVAAGIAEFYRPETAEAPLPNTVEACLASLAGKIDTLVGDFLVGMAPTGSEDPHGLRRQAVGVWRILLEKNLALHLPEVLWQAAQLQPPVAPKDGEDTTFKVEAFILGRAFGLLQKQGYPVDELRAVGISAEPSIEELKRTPDRDRALYNVRRTVGRLIALHSIRGEPDFKALAAAFKRAANILKQAPANGFGPVRSDLLQDDAERRLLDSLQRVEGQVRLRLQDGEFEESLRIMVALKPDVDAFFDKVMVMAEAEDVRKNRLGLLSQLVGLFKSVADLSQLQS